MRAEPGERIWGYDVTALGLLNYIMSITGEHVWRYDTESAFTDLARIGTIRLICQKTIEDLKQEDLHHIQVFLRCMTSVKLALFVSLKCRSYVRRALMHDLYIPQMLRTITV